MSVLFSRAELTKMIYVLGESDKNSLLAQRIYHQRYPDLRQPRVEVLEKLMHRFDTTGSVNYLKKKVVNFPVSNDENELSVLLQLQENVHASTREIGRELDMSKSTVNRIIRKYKFHPYRMELHQELYGNDFENRMDFCNTMMEKITFDRRFHDQILFTDESTFKNNGTVNRHNMHYYALENPKWVREVDFQNKWSINVWGGVIGTQVVGPFFFDQPLRGMRYLEFLRHDLPPLLENIDLETRQNLWYQHDGAPPHYHGRVRAFLDRWRVDQWIGRGGPIPWPARSPDLTPCDYFLWGYVKEQVYQERPTTRDNMKNRIKIAFESVTPEILVNVRLSFLRRIELCVREDGRLFEHLL